MITKNRFEPLDALRGIAALGVVLFHYTANYRKNISNLDFPEYLDFKFGFYGVPLFFIISGFVIFMTINKVKSTSEFIYKRFIRLYPTFWICMLFTFFGVKFFGLFPQHFTTWKDAFFNLFMFYRLFPDIKDVDGAYWSLLPELQFYFLIALVLLFKQVRNIKWICLIWFTLIIIENFFHHIRFLGIIIDFKFGGFFIAGILFYKIAVEKENTFWNHLFIIVTLVINVLLYMDWNNEAAIVFIPFIYLIFYMFTFGLLNWLNGKVLLYMGAISYPLYLIHQNLGYIMIKQFEIWGFTGLYVLLFTVLFFIGLASFITFYLEKPLLKMLRNKLEFRSEKDNLTGKE